jgi:hypothetical protein
LSSSSNNNNTSNGWRSSSTIKVNNDKSPEMRNFATATNISAGSWSGDKSDNIGKNNNSGGNTGWNDSNYNSNNNRNNSWGKPAEQASWGDPNAAQKVRAPSNGWGGPTLSAPGW